MNQTLTNLKSGIVVFLVALPLCLGIALACNVPLFSGIIAGIVGGLIVTVLSGSVLSVSGPAAGLTSIVIAAVASLGSFEIFLAAVLFAGIVQIALGLLKCGGISNFVPVAVIKGMLAGIGIILIMKQLPHLLGYDRDPEGDFEFMQSDGNNTISDLYYMLLYISPGPAVIGVISMIILIIAEMKFYTEDKILSYIPAPLLVVIFGILLSISFEGYENLKLASDHLVALPVIRDAEDARNTIITPDFSGISQTHFWVTVLTLAAVASLESLLSVEAVDKIDPQKRDYNSNQELVAQSIG